MKTTKALATGLILLLSLSHADAQVLRKKKSKEGVPVIVNDSLKITKSKPKPDEGYEKLKTKSYSGYYDYYGDRFFWDRERRLYYTVDKNGERTYYEKRFQPY